MSSMVTDERYAISAENMMARFPGALKQDGSVRTIAEVEAGWLERDIPDIDLAKIYANIDRAPEGLLDILAKDFAVDWYDYDYSVESKRELIKSSFYVHKFLGTPAAVSRMLSSVFPGSYIEEWFTYGGEPHHFQIVLETRDSRENANAKDILDAVGKVKRLSSHLDGIVYQWATTIIIGTSGHGYTYRVPSAGQPECGTEPWRATVGAEKHTELEIKTRKESFGQSVQVAGTVPWRSTEAGVDSRELEVATQSEDWKNSAPATGRTQSGTEPWRRNRGAARHAELEAGSGTEAFGHSADLAGTKPYRSTEPALDSRELEVTTHVEDWKRSTPGTGQTRSGTEPWTATAGGARHEELEAGTKKETWLHDAPVSGAGKADGVADTGAFYAVAEGEGFRHEVNWCGTGYCKSRTEGER